MPILLIELEAIRRKRLIFESKELEGFTHNLEGFTQSKLLLDIETIRRKESSPFFPTYMFIQKYNFEPSITLACPVFNFDPSTLLTPITFLSQSI